MTPEEMRDAFSFGCMVFVTMPLCVLANYILQPPMWGSIVIGIVLGCASSLIANFIWEIFE